jgi:hypothetical protein
MIPVLHFHCKTRTFPSQYISLSNWCESKEIVKEYFDSTGDMLQYVVTCLEGHSNHRHKQLFLPVLIARSRPRPATRWRSSKEDVLRKYGGGCLKVKTRSMELKPWVANFAGKFGL